MIRLGLDVCVMILASKQSRTKPHNSPQNNESRHLLKVEILGDRGLFVYWFVFYKMCFGLCCHQLGMMSWKVR